MLSTSLASSGGDDAPRLVAVKKAKSIMGGDGLNPSALREIRLLKELHHPNIISILDVYTKRSNLYIVFELMYEDLEHLIIDKHIPFTAADVKGFLHQVLAGVAYMHAQWVMHRDLKPANCLIDRHGLLKLTDFGLARVFAASEACRYTREVQTIWYRAPELIFGAHDYTHSIDIWSIGCTFAELLLRVPFLPGASEIDQLSRMCAALGTPCEQNWPGVSALPYYVEFEARQAPPLNAIFPAATPSALHLLASMLVYDPSRRISAADALAHPYFANPAPTPPGRLPLPRCGILDRKMNAAAPRFPPEAQGGSPPKKSGAVVEKEPHHSQATVEDDKHLRASSASPALKLTPSCSKKLF